MFLECDAKSMPGFETCLAGVNGAQDGLVVNSRALMDFSVTIVPLLTALVNDESGMVRADTSADTIVMRDGSSALTLADVTGFTASKALAAYNAPIKVSMLVQFTISAFSLIKIMGQVEHTMREKRAQLEKGEVTAGHDAALGVMNNLFSKKKSVQEGEGSRETRLRSSNKL